MSSSGFGHAPISKALVFASGIASVLWQASRSKHSSLYRAGGASPGWLLGLVNHALAFDGPAELLFGLFCIYNFRVLERQAGSAKYGVFVAVSVLLSTLVQYTASRWLLRESIAPASNRHWHAASGPYGLIFASFVQYLVNVPALSRFTVVGGWQLSDKAFVYLAGLQLCFSGGLRTLVAGAAGLLAGIVYRLNLLGMRRWKMPKFVCQLASKTLGRLLGTSTPSGVAAGSPPRPGSQRTGSARPPQHAQAGAAGQRAPGGRSAWHAGPPPGVHAAGASAPSVPHEQVTASPDAVAQLVAMGFEPEAATQALQAAHNDVQAAISLLV